MKRGLTLLEVLIASALGLIALSLTGTLFWATSTSSARTQARVDLQQEAVRALDSMVADLTQCTPAGVGVLYTNDPNRPTVLCLHRVADVNNVAPPAPIFERKLRVYWQTRHSLYRRDLPDSQPPSLSDLGLDPLSQTVATRGVSQGNLLSMAVSGQGHTRFSEHLESLQLTCTHQSDPPTTYQATASPPSVTNPLQVRLVLEKEVKGGITRNSLGNPCERFEIERTVWFRDGE